MKHYIYYYQGHVFILRFQATIVQTSTGDERSSLLATGSSVKAEEQKGKIVKALFYGVQVFYSFFIM